ncbi:MAG TPA: ABC transporter ATP-binding protein [Bauldia sp.]|nr:ABC transporter ATP-binding protein [Bauldia sp.]
MADLLVLAGVSAGYGDATVIAGIDLGLGERKALALLGRNGTGKTTLINTIVGLTRLGGGTIRLAGRDVTRLAPELRAAAGIGWVPQERGIFRSLSVEENLTAVAMPGPWTSRRVFALFPRLAERRRNMGANLSGGEQQMLAIGRALVLNPKLILLDEPLEGLAPIVVGEVMSALRRIRDEEGTAMIVVEQKAATVLAIADDAVILDRGRIVHRGTSAALMGRPDLLDAHLGARRAVDR